MITVTFTRSQPLIINGKRFMPGRTYTMSSNEWAEIYSQSAFSVVSELKDKEPKEKKKDAGKENL